MADTAFQLTGKVALVTGGGSGIGAATCRELTRAGARVYVADINLPAAETIAKDLKDATAIQMDVADPASIAKAVAKIQQLHILVNNAGIGHVGTIAEVAPEDFDRVMKVNVYSLYYVTQALLPLLLKTRGSIVNIGSVAGFVGVKRRFAYCTSKGAVLEMTRQLAVDYPQELRVNAIAPGTVDSPFVEAYLEKFHKHEKEETKKALIARQPVGRLGTPQDVASAVRYLCSAEAEFMQGSVLTIDGGWTSA